MLEFSARHQPARFDQGVNDCFIGVADFTLVGDDALAFEAGRLVGERAVLVDGVGNPGVDPALLEQPRARGPKLEVLAPVARRGVDEARARVLRHMVAVEQRNDKPVAARMERMGANHRGERIPFDFAKKFKRADPGRVENALGERLGDDVGRPDLRPIIGRGIRYPIAPVSDAPGEGDRAIARDGPGRRGPDDDGGVLGLDWERHIHRVADMVFIFDLGLSKRRLFDHAPHHRLRAAIEQPARDKFEDFARDLRFGGIAHRRVGMVPIADDAQPLEFFPLHPEPMFGVGAAFPAEGDDGLRIREVGLHLALASVEFFLDLPFDRQPVTVPAGHVVGFPARHLMRTDDNVLQRLVQRRADVDIAVGVRRPVVKNEFGAALAALAQLRIQILARPARQNFRLLLRQTPAHRKIRLRQVQSARIIEA